MEITHVAPYNAETIPLQFDDGQPTLISVGGQDGFNNDINSTVAASDQTGIPPWFNALFAKANQNGIAGSPYELPPAVGNTHFYHGRELNRLRKNLWNSIGYGQNPASNIPHYRQWALISDQFQIPATGDNLPLVVKALNFWGRRYTDVDLCFVEQTPAVRVFGKQRITKTETKTVQSASQLPAWTPIGSIGRNGDRFTSSAGLLIKFTFRLRIPVTPSYTAVGRTDLFEFHSQGPFGQDWVVNYRAKPGVNLSAEEAISLTLENISPTLSLGGNATLNMEIERTSEGYSDGGGTVARVFNPADGNWTRKPVFLDFKLWNGTKFNYLDGPENFTDQKITAEADGITSSSKAYWMARSVPRAFHNYKSVGGLSEQWLWSRRFNGYAPETITNATQFPVVAPWRSIRAPRIVENAAYFDGRTDAWPEFETLTLTIPNAPEGPADFALPSLRLGNFDYGPVTTNCYYYRIPLGISTREMDQRIAWFRDAFGSPSNVDGTGGGIPVDPGQKLAHETETPSEPFPTRTYYKSDVPGYERGRSVRDDYAGQGITQGDALFLGARLTNEDGKRFWYQDLFAEVPYDLERKQHRFRHWFIRDDGSGGHELILLLDRREIVIDALGNKAWTTYWPEVQVNHSDYKRAWGGILGQNGDTLWMGNLVEFHPPFRFFNTLIENSPIQSWTIGRKSGAAWTPGSTLKLHVPKKFSRTEIVDYTPWPREFVEISTTNPDVGFLAGYSGAHLSVLHDFTIWRSSHRKQVLTNSKRQLAYWPVLDLRFHECQNDTLLPGSTSRFYPVREISPDNFSISDSGLVDLSKITLPEGGFVMATYNTRAGMSDEVTVEVGNVKQGGDWQGFEYYTFSGHRKTLPYVEVSESTATVQKPFGVWSVWPCCYRRHPLDVSPTVTNTADGSHIKVVVSVQSDALLTYTATYETSAGVAYGAPVTFELHCPRGETEVPSILSPSLSEYRLKTFTLVSCKQDFAVRITGRELDSNPSVGWQISGTPFLFHYRETKRLLDAVIDNT